MQYGWLLPDQLRGNKRIWHGEMRPHMDLALELKGQGRDWAHLSEIGLRMGLPGDLFTGKTEVDLPQTAEDWIEMPRHVSCDLVLIAMVTMAWLRVQGQIGINVAAPYTISRTGSCAGPARKPALLNCS